MKNWLSQLTVSVNSKNLDQIGTKKFVLNYCGQRNETLSVDGIYRWYGGETSKKFQRKTLDMNDRERNHNSNVRYSFSNSGRL